MSNERPSLRDTLCKLYAYHDRVEAELKRVIEEGSERRFPLRPFAEECPDILSARAELKSQLKESFLVERRAAGLPVQESEAWHYAVGFVAEHLPRLADPNGCFEWYCKWQLSQSGSEDERNYWLTRAMGDMHGEMEREFLEIRPHRRYTWLPAERRQRENALLRDPGYRGLAYGIRKLDKRGGGDELLREVWERFRDEARDAGLPPAPPFPSDGQDGEGAGRESAVAPGDPALATAKQPQPAHARAAASYEWVCTQRPDLVPTDGRGKYPRELWEYIHDNDCPAYRDENGKTIEPPSFETWKRQVRAGQADPNNPKTSQRAGREHGKSIVKASQV
jgi:hypothetical protein